MQTLPAIKKSTEVVKRELGKYFTEPGLTIDLKKVGCGFYEVYYSYHGDIYTRANDAVKLELGEWKDWQEYEAERKLEKMEAVRAQIKKQLKEAGFYKTERVGILVAVKIYEMLEYYDRKREGLTTLQLLTLEDQMKEDVTHTNRERFMADLPELADDSGRVTVTARRALANLKEAGLISNAGKTSGMKYYAERIK